MKAQQRAPKRIKLEMVANPEDKWLHPGSPEMLPARPADPFAGLTQEQLQRYEFYRRSAFPVDALRKELHKFTGMEVDKKVGLAMAGVAKLFVAELMESAFAVMDERKEGSGATQPKHIREAFRRLRPGWKHGLVNPSVRGQGRLLSGSRKLCEQ
eukprot:TRINITY_DN2977_c0_g1_i2.p1 TRINITY_DN2977_c0_g1~~TRINITY_DN2977_c0_g1_i2.p1  ORF type:complete len:155 (+),score=30.13 TRINITY_DN2977_c0_g1_i2:245-709(+)